MSWNSLVRDHWLGSTVPAVIDDHEVLTGQDLLELAAGASRFMDALGFERGQAVPVLMDESAEAIALLVGGAMSARPLAPLGTKLPVSQLALMVNGLDSPALICSTDHAELGAAVIQECNAKLVVRADPLERAAPLAGDCAADDVVTVVHTSGTTGQPKPILQRQDQMAARIGVYRRVMKIGPGDRYCSASPFYHTASVAMDATVLAMGVGIIPQDWFSVENWRRAGRLGATCTLLVPTMMELLLEAGALHEARPRVLQYGAMPVHPDTLRAVHDALPDTDLLQIFGQTEVSPISHLSHSDHLRALESDPSLLLSVGRPVPDTELVIENPDSDGIGEVAVRADHAFVVDPDGWRRTGDLGSLTPDGYLLLQGRVNDRIIRGGENIYPVEIESLIRAHPQVADVAVVGIPDRRWGETVAAAVVASDPANPPTEAELQDCVARGTAKFKVPAAVTIVDALPRNPSGKVLRTILRAELDPGKTEGHPWANA